MRRFLRLFDYVRELELRCQRECDGRDAAEAHVRRLETEIARLNAQLIEENHKFTDTMALHAIGKRIHSKADPIPADFQPAVRPGRPHPRALVMDREQTVRADLQKMWNDLGN
jgi:uncharacterized small protein (DUF1192 family)